MASTTSVPERFIISAEVGSLISDARRSSKLMVPPDSQLEPEELYRIPPPPSSAYQRNFRASSSKELNDRLPQICLALTCKYLGQVAATLNLARLHPQAVPSWGYVGTLSLILRDPLTLCFCDMCRNFRPCDELRYRQGEAPQTRDAHNCPTLPFVTTIERIA